MGKSGPKIKDRTGKNPGERMCACCKESLPVSEFGINRDVPDGLAPYCKECKREHDKKYRHEHADIWNALKKNYRDKVRLLAIQQYGGCCACCGESTIEFLAIDHIYGGGTQHRRQVGAGHVFYLWLKKHEYPDGFRVLCHNCNASLGHYGYCPHGKLDKLDK